MTWIPEEEALRSFALKVDEISVSRLFIDDAQRKAAFERPPTTPRRRTSPPAPGPVTRAACGRWPTCSLRRVAWTRRARPCRLSDLPGEQGPRNAFARALFSRVLEGRWQKPAESPIPPATPAG